MVDMARKVVGVGSVGTRAFIVLLQGRDAQDPLFLQVKEATRSVLEDHLPPSRYTNPGERVVQGQRVMQAASDIFLGWTKGVQANRYLYWRQLRDMKGSALVDTMSAFMLEYYAGLCGWTLARAHARSGDGIAITTYLGAGDEFDAAITDFSQRYADQNEADYQASWRRSAAAGYQRSKVCDHYFRHRFEVAPGARAARPRVSSTSSWSSDSGGQRSATTSTRRILANRPPTERASSISSSTALAGSSARSSASCAIHAAYIAVAWSRSCGVSC